MNVFDITSQVQEEKERKEKEREIKILEENRVAREKESLKISQEGLEVNKRTLKRANISIIIAIAALVISILSVLF